MFFWLLKRSNGPLEIPQQVLLIFLPATRSLIFGVIISVKIVFKIQNIVSKIQNIIFNIQSIVWNIIINNETYRPFVTILIDIVWNIKNNENGYKLLSILTAALCGSHWDVDDAFWSGFFFMFCPGGKRSPSSFKTHHLTSFPFLRTHSRWTVALRTPIRYRERACSNWCLGRWSSTSAPHLARGATVEGNPAKAI